MPVQPRTLRLRIGPNVDPNSTVNTHIHLPVELGAGIFCKNYPLLWWFGVCSPKHSAVETKNLLLYKVITVSVRERLY
jgi:hypothetical protein